MGIKVEVTGVPAGESVAVSVNGAASPPIIAGGGTAAPPTNGGSTRIQAPPGMNETRWANSQLASGQEKTAQSIGAEGGRLYFRTPKSSTHDRTIPGGGGQLKIDWGKSTASTNGNFLVSANGVPLWRNDSQMNQLQLGFGMGGVSGNVMDLPLDSEIMVEMATPEATYSSGVDGPPTWIAEVSFPGRGTAVYTW